MDLFQLTNTVALVTGASGGLGRAIAKLFAQAGARIVVTDLDREACDRLAGELSAEGGEALSLPCDLGDRAALEAMFASAQQWQGRVDCIVCCAGIEGHVGSLSAASDTDWDCLMRVNLQSVHWLSSLAIPPMARRGRGSVIFIASIAGLRGNRAIGLYGIAKAGLMEMARNLAVEWGPQGVTVNTIAPGLIETPFSTQLLANPDFMAKRLSMTPLRRVGQPEEIAGIAVMLASRAGAFVTGQTIVADGGTLISDGN
jgi:NAD(P)-dependent dehydrogenase (short-subunit alcohol dehydrogenase family)